MELKIVIQISIWIVKNVNMIKYEQHISILINDKNK